MHREQAVTRTKSLLTGTFGFATNLISRGFETFDSQISQLFDRMSFSFVQWNSPTSMIVAARIVSVDDMVAIYFILLTVGWKLSNELFPSETYCKEKYISIELSCW
jgi:hypothetical protein